jgi:hypothetical protein
VFIPIALSAVLAFLLAGCSGTDIELKNLIRTYTGLLSEAYHTKNFATMTRFVSGHYIDQIDMYIQWQMKERRLLKINSIDMEFESIEVTRDGKRAVVRTTERWSQHFVDSDTKARLTEDESIFYANTYEIVKKEKRWMIEWITSHRLEEGGPRTPVGGR